MQEQYKIIKNTLNLYAVFGYILPGFFLVFLFKFDFLLMENKYDIFNKVNNKNDYFIQSLNSFKDKPTDSQTIIWFVALLFLFYILGHFVSAFSSFVFERILVRNYLGYPSINLLKNDNQNDNQNEESNNIFKNFLKSMDVTIIENIKYRVNKLYKNSNQNKVDLGEYFWICYTYIINHKPYLSERIHHFVNLYGFTRNISGTLLILVIIKSIYFFIGLFEVIIFQNSKWILYLFCNLYLLIYIIILSLILILMFWSYLKLFRRQSYDLYLLFLTVFDEVNGVDVKAYIKRKHFKYQDNIYNNTNKNTSKRK